MGNCFGKPKESHRRREGGVELKHIEKKNVSRPHLFGSSTGFEDSVPMPEVHVAPSRTPAASDPDLIEPAPRRAQTSTGSSMPRMWDSDTAAVADQTSYKGSSAENKPARKTRRDHPRYQTYQGEDYPPYTPPRGLTYPPRTTTAPAPAPAPAPSFGSSTVLDEPRSYDQDTSAGPTTTSVKIPARYKNRGGNNRQAREEGPRGRDASDPSQVEAALETVPRERPAAGPRSSSDPSRLQTMSTQHSSRSSDSARHGREGRFRLDDRERRRDRR